MRGLSPNWLLGTETLHLYIRRMCQGNGEVTAAHPFCVILQKDRLYFKGKDRAVFLDKREFTGPIYTQIKEAVDFVLRNIRLGATIDGLVRKEKYELPPEAIREMIINAHCHRNLLDESCIQVAVYDDRLEVTSPGGLYNGLTYEEVMNGHSKIRNKGIANIFSQMGLVEAWGSGIKRILNAAEEYGLPKPRFQEFDNMFRVELFRVNPITDQANQATNQVNQDFERLDFFSCLYSRFTCKFREISYSHKIKLE